MTKKETKWHKEDTYKKAEQKYKQTGGNRTTKRRKQAMANKDNKGQ